MTLDRTRYGIVVGAFFVLFLDQSATHGGILLSRNKRIIVGNNSMSLPPRPLPIGNLSSPHGEADCYFFNGRFYCISQFLATLRLSYQYCKEQKMTLLTVENEEEHEYLYSFMSSNVHGSALKFLQKADFLNDEEEYSNYVFRNISPGMLVKCISICQPDVRPYVDEGRVVDFENREYIGLAVKVKWKTGGPGGAHWHPAQNLQLGGFRSQQKVQKENFLQKSDFPSEEEYSDYVFNNLTPGMSIVCVSICDHGVQPLTEEGRVLDFEYREYVGLAVKVQWKTAGPHWHPATNLQLGSPLTKGYRANEGILSTAEEDLFEPGDRVRFRNYSSSDGLAQGVHQGEIGIVSDVETVDGNGLVFFPSNKGWRGPLSYLEIIDKRKGSGTYWTSGIFEKSRGWKWYNTNQPIIFTNWSLEEDRELTNSCLVIKFHKQGKWYSANCNDRNYFICKK